MPRYRDPPSRSDRAKAITAVLAVHVAMSGLILIGGGADGPKLESQAPTQMIDVTLPPPPPLPPPEPAAKAEREAGAAGRKAEPSPIVLPPPRIALVTPNPLSVAPIAGSGSAASAGAASAGTGPGAGGAGDGRGGGGAGGIGSDVRLLGGHRARLPAWLLQQFAADRGVAQLLLTIAGTGRVRECSVLQGTGSGEVDQALCNVMLGQSRWQAARDLQGRPISVKIRYTAIWSKY